MIIPTARVFARISAPVVRQGVWPMRNPRWFKYDWWIVTEDNPVESSRDPRFRGQAFKIATHAAMTTAAELKASGVRYFIHNWAVKRADPTAPWDIPRLVREGKQVAPAYDDDPDPPWQDHK